VDIFTDHRGCCSRTMGRHVGSAVAFQGNCRSTTSC
jgi:hypothetical protein